MHLTIWIFLPIKFTSISIIIGDKLDRSKRKIDSTLIFQCLILNYYIEASMSTQKVHHLQNQKQFYIWGILAQDLAACGSFIID